MEVHHVNVGTFVVEVRNGEEGVSYRSGGVDSSFLLSTKIVYVATT